MARVDPNDEWIGHVQPVGLVVAPIVLARYGLIPEIQTRVETEAVRAFISPLSEDGKAKGADPRALKDPWAFFHGVLGWRASQVAGGPGGPALPDDLFLKVEESDTEIAPDWAVADPEGGWQVLVRVEGPGVKPDERGALAGWEATPHQRFERLLREKERPIGILVTDDDLRLVYAPRRETSGWMTFPLRSLAEVGGRPMLGALKLLLSSFRLHNDATERRLPALLKASRDAQADVSTRLAAQVLGALHELLRGLHAADRQRIEALARTNPEHLYDGLLAVLLRLVFLLYAEDRDLIPSRTDAEARAFYAQGYSVRSLYGQLIDDRAHYPDTMDERRGAWGRLLALFSLVHHGDSTRRWIHGRGGRLFDPEAYPFLQGQEKAEDAPAPALVSDGCILRILDSLITVDGEKLSYRTLDVEQIGSVYETVMGFAIETRPGPAVAIKAGKNDRTPVFVDLASLAATKGSERAKFVKEEAGRHALSDKVAKPLAAATGQAEALQALRAIIDERGSPGGHVSPPGTPLLQPTDERRRTGSHYTPRSLTEPIVRHALEPAFERIGPDAKPEEVAALKVCDPAMGSGAFLVEACRALGERMVRAWARWPETRPKIPDDEDEPLHARRFVAQRCLYGVDKNPLATDLAKLSLWLATLARDHEFTFLDHALKSGDSLVGLSQAEIAAAHWDASRPGLPLFQKLAKDRLAEAMKGRAEIQAAPDDTARVIQEARHRSLEERIKDIRLIGDAVIAAFFSADKAKARERARADIERWLIPYGSLAPEWDELAAVSATLRQGLHPLTPFHWEIEFPEVFGRENGGFDAIVGNPPFAGKNTTVGWNRDGYVDWLKTLHEGAHGSSDLVAHFFLRAFGLLRDGGVFGLIATNKIGQGDTRETGLTTVIANGGVILRALRRLKWPGEAAVVVSIVHIVKGVAATPTLDGRPVQRISAYLVEGDLDRAPARLAANARKAFQGSIVLGIGFTFDDGAAAKGEAESLATMRALVAKHRHNFERVFPFIGGEEVNTSPTHAHHRYVIDFADFPLRRDDGLDPWEFATSEQRHGWLREGIVPNDYPRPVAADWPDLLAIVERMVKPGRLKVKDGPGRNLWWRFLRRRDRLYTTIAPLDRLLVTGAAAVMHHMFAMMPNGLVFSHKTIVFAISSFSGFALLQSSVHEIWSRQFGTTFGSVDALTYNPSQVFQTFPMPVSCEESLRLEIAGQTYRDHRAALMIARNEGLTKTYNRYHDRSETAEDIERLRALHADMDRAVLESYRWHDLAQRTETVFLDETNEDDYTYQGRLFWTSELRDEVLARLLALNAERHAEEVGLGIAPGMKGKERDADGDELEDESDVA
jgi:hypothetical protein